MKGESLLDQNDTFLSDNISLLTYAPIILSNILLAVAFFSTYQLNTVLLNLSLFTIITLLAQFMLNLFLKTKEFEKLIFAALLILTSSAFWIICAQNIHEFSWPQAKTLMALIISGTLYTYYKSDKYIGPLTLALCHVFFISVLAFLPISYLLESSPIIFSSLFLSILCQGLIKNIMKQSSKKKGLFLSFLLLFLPILFVLSFFPIGTARAILLSIWIGQSVRCFFILKKGHSLRASRSLSDTQTLLVGILLCSVDPLLGAACVALFGLSLAIRRLLIGQRSI